MNKETIKRRIVRFLGDRKGSFSQDVVTHPAWGMARKMNLDYVYPDFYEALMELVEEGVVEEVPTTGFSHQQSWFKLAEGAK